MYPEQAEIRRGLSRLRKEEQAIRRMDISPEEKQERIRRWRYASVDTLRSCH